MQPIKKKPSQKLANERQAIAKRNRGKGRNSCVTVEELAHEGSILELSRRRKRGMGEIMQKQK